MTFEGFIRVEDEKGNELTRRSFAGAKSCRALLIRYAEAFKIGIDEERIFIVVETELTDSKTKSKNE